MAAKPPPPPKQKNSRFSITTICTYIPNMKPVAVAVIEWVNGLLWKGSVKTLEADDIFDLHVSESADNICAQLERCWETELRKKSKSFSLALLKAFGPYLFCGTFLAVGEALKIFQIWLFQHLIAEFSNPHFYLRDALRYAVAVGACAIGESMVYHWYNFHCQITGLRVRTGAKGLLLKKILCLSAAAKNQTTSGQLINIMSSDVQQLESMNRFLIWVLIGPIEAVVVFVLVYDQFGSVVLSGYVLIVLVLLLQVLIIRSNSAYWQQKQEHADERVKIMNEIIAGIRTIKMYCWEKPFENIIEQIRNRRLTTVITELYFFNSRAIMAVIVIAYTLSYKHISAEAIFPALAYFTVVNDALVERMAWALKTILDTRVSIKRIENILLLEEKHTEISQPNVVTRELNCDVTELLGEQQRPAGDPLDEESESLDCSICLDHVSSQWEKHSASFRLQNINLEIKKGELVAVIGPVGAGKTSLLMTVLKEMHQTSGFLNVDGRVAYVSQIPWIFSSTFRENILFGQPYKQADYQRVITQAALEKDVLALPHGDMTRVGERGVTLSGGQKARVNLARALYRHADIYLYDDPLSAVDATVGRQIFEQCILKLKQNSTQILVTHQLQYLLAVDRIVIMDAGCVVATGSYKELMNAGIDVGKYIATLDEKTPLHRQLSRQISEAAIYENCEEQMEEEEEREVGTVGMHIYKEYFLSGARPLQLVVFLSANAMFLFIYCFSDWWLSKWSNEDQALASPSNFTLASSEGVDDRFSFANMAVYCILVIILFGTGIVRGFLYCQMVIRSAVVLHTQMFQSIVRSRMSFFDTNPSGRILNRFSSDLCTAEDSIPDNLTDLIQCLMLFLGHLFIIVFINPWTIFLSVPLLLILVKLRSYYLMSSRDLSRLVSLARSPIYSHLNSTIEGLHVIRAYREQKMVYGQFRALLDKNSQMEVASVYVTGWFSSKLEFMAALFLSAVSIGTVLAASDLNAGLVGLTMTSALQLITIMQYTVRLSAEIEMEMPSVERVLAYTKLPPEPSLRGKQTLSPHWGRLGQITFQDVCLSYKPDDPDVLKHVSFIIRPREKIGIVGRTGAGKSSLIEALLRLTEPRGKIFIDNVDIAEIGVHDLREKLAIIPQDPLLFCGTLRKNLDPFGYHNDNTLWACLDEIQLGEILQLSHEGLDYSVSEGGSNFSVGQRQLICLARAMLSGNKILILDEATSNVDNYTDAKIQQAIRRKFHDCTVLTIAHRIHTVMDSDRILVMDNGKLSDFGDPHILLQNKQSHFFNLVKNTGDSEMARLMEIARSAYFKRIGSPHSVHNQ